VTNKDRIISGLLNSFHQFQIIILNEKLEKKIGFSINQVLALWSKGYSSIIALVFHENKVLE